jgi:hypothetical protein
MAPRRFPAGPVLFAAALVMLALHAWLARYAHPMADDLWYASKDVSIGAWAAATWEYHHWNGRYASNFLMLFGPMRGGLEAIGLYRAVPVALMAATFGGALLLLRTWSNDRGADRACTGGALLWTVLHLHAMPDIAEGYYWYTGAVTYQLANALFLVYLALLLRLHRRPSLPGRCLAAALLFLLIGFNEVMMLLMVVGHVVLLLLLRMRREGLPSWLWMLLAIALTGAALMILAPGNAVRSDRFPLRHQLFPSVVMSLAQTARFLLIWCSSPVVVGLAGLFIVEHERLRERFPLPALVGWANPWLPLLAIPSVVFLCVFPSYWSTGVLGQYRTLNVACFLALPLLFVALAHLMPRMPLSWSKHFRRKEAHMVFMLIIVLGLAASRNGGRATEDLLTGRAERSDQQLWQRYALLERSRPDGIIELPPIADAPRSLYVLELRSDPSFLQNSDYALWFGWKEVHLAGQHKAP